LVVGVAQANLSLEPAPVEKRLVGVLEPGWLFAAKGIEGGKGWKVESFRGCFQVTFALVEEALARPPCTCHHE
jgi:hypothetical protein